MNFLEKFKDFEITLPNEINGGVHHMSYHCDDGTGFSTPGPGIDHNLASERCGSGSYVVREVHFI